MLWVHVGVDGSIDCQVNVGNKVRQGNGFELFIVTETNNVENFEINRVGYIKPGEQEIVSLNVPVRREENIEFELNRPSQANSFFKGGATYNGYMASIPSDATTFYGNGGHIQLVIYAVSVDGRSENTQNVTVFVEPTYGNKYVGISDNDYSVILGLIDDLYKYKIANIKDGTGANSIQQNQDGTGGKFDFSGKNPNAFSFDATLNGELDYGALGAFSSSFGGKGQARGKRSFQVGTNTIAYGNYTFASGSDSVAMGPASHVEGYNNTTGPTADSSHAEGGENLVTSNRGHVEGYKNIVKGMNGHGEGENVLVTENAEAGHAEGTNTKANNLSAHAEGQQTEANGINSHSENTLTKANGDSSHAEGYGNEVNSYAGHIEGSGNKILNTLPSSGGGDTPGPSPINPDDPNFNINEHLGYNSHVEGSLNISYGYNSHTEGTKNTTFGHYAHTEGSGNKNYGTNNHMEGSQNKMSSTAAVAITDSHIEGTNNNITNPCSNLHMGGVSNTGGADGAYVMGHNNDVSSTARYSATFGKGLKTTDEDTIVLGTYNKVQQGTGRMVVIGNGTSDTARKNAVEIMRDGRVKISKAPEENDDAVRLWELHSKQNLIYGAQAEALDSTITKAKVDKYEGYETKINSNTNEISTIKGTISDLSSIDDHLSTTSTKPVQNKVITNAITNAINGIGYINQFFEKDYKNLDSDAVVNKGLIVSTNGDVVVNRHLTIKGATKLTTGLAPIHTFKFMDNTTNCSLDVYWDNIILGTNPTTYSYVGVLHGFNGGYAQDVYGTYQVSGATLQILSVFYNDMDGLKQVVWNFINDSKNTNVFVTDGKLDTIGQKQDDGSVIYNDSLTVNADGNVNVHENLIVQGNATLSGVTISGDTDADYIQSNKRNVDLMVHSAYGHCVLRVSDHYAMVFGDDLGENFTVSLKDDPSPTSRGGKIVGHIGGGASYVPTSNSDLTPKKYVDGEIGKLQTDWEFLGKVAEKTFSKAFTEVKPGSSGIPSGNATVNVTATTYQKKVEGAIVGYKTIVDITCRCEQFNLNDVGLNVLLSKVGSRWFVPRMAIAKVNMASTAFNTMMDKLNAQKDDVGISVEEVAVFKDNRGVSGNPGALNVSGVTNGQVVYDASEFRVFAVMLELDKDNEGKAIPCTGAHYKISIFHPQTIL
jgi:hypothetical protein